jgi:hypothetical protein
MAGEGSVAPYRRSEDLRNRSAPYEIVRGWSHPSTEVALRVSPLLLLCDAAVVQPDLRELLTELDEARHPRIRRTRSSYTRVAT